MEYKIAMIPGDGVGPEVIAQAQKVLDRVADHYGHDFEFEYLLAGGVAIDQRGKALPDETLKEASESHGVMLGAVGGPKWDELPGKERPEQAILGLREKLGLFGNLRPALLFPQLADACPLKNELIKNGLDILIIRELTGGIYFGEKGTRQTDRGAEAYDVEVYSEIEVERIARLAFSMAMQRRRNLISVDKANVLESSRLWRKVVSEVSEDFPQVSLSHMYVDNAAMQLVRNPGQFDCIVTGNMFGDILSDEASMLAGSIGMLPSASLRNDRLGLYEPIHGSAPDIAGKDIVNPIGTILSASMMLRYSLDLHKEADSVANAVMEFLKEGFRTADIMSKGKEAVGTDRAGTLIAERIY